MNTPLPFFNWSFSKAINTCADNFGKARIRIIFTILLFALLKTVIVISMGAANAQWLQVTRASVAFLLYLTITKLVLYRPQWLHGIMHVMMIAGIIIVWNNIFMFAHKVNLVTVQFVYMIIVCSFYTMGTRLGIIYSAASVLPVMLMLSIQGNSNSYSASASGELASPGYEIIVALNFISICLTHYLFYNAFRKTIEEKEKLNQQLILSVAEANKLAQTKTDFLSTMSHELRTPLNSVIGITEMLLEDKPEERNKENLKLLQFSAHDLLSLINNILDINKLDSHKMVLEKVPFQLAGFMQNACAGLKLKAKAKQIAFSLEIDKQLEGIYILSDPTRLSQLIYNLGSNALKFTDTGSITVKLACISKTANGISVQFSVADTGIGIHADKHESIFEQFTQAETDTTRKYGGSGLGLAIVKEILALFNSSIQLESSTGKGAKFYFTIDFALATTTIPQDTVTNDTDNLNNLKVLVADDNDINRIVIKKQLSKLSVSATIVDGGRQAFEECKAHHFDAVFIDLNMPFVSGYDAIKMIRALPGIANATTSIIAFTASITEQEKIVAAGFDDYIYKPVKLTDLQDKLAKIAQQKKERQAI